MFAKNADEKTRLLVIADMLMKAHALLSNLKHHMQDLHNGEFNQHELGMNAMAEGLARANKFLARAFPNNAPGTTNMGEMNETHLPGIVEILDEELRGIKSHITKE